MGSAAIHSKKPILSNYHKKVIRQMTDRIRKKSNSKDIDPDYDPTFINSQFKDNNGK